VTSSAGAPAAEATANSSLCSVLGEQPGEDEQAVERGTQLVRDVREELRLVAGCQVELFRALFDLLPGLLDLAVLDLDIAFLPG